jgi:hypothetical protein
MFDLLLSVRLEGVGGGNSRPEMSALLAGLQKAIALTPGTIAAGRHTTKVANPADIGKWLDDAPIGIATFKSGADRNASAQLVVQPKGTELHLGFSSDSSSLADRHLFDSACMLLGGFAKEHADSAVIGTYSGLSVRSLDYASARPPRDYLVLDQSSLVDMLDPRAWKSPGEKEAGETLLSAELPAGVERKRSGPVTIICWANGTSLDQPDAVAEALARRDRWLGSHEIGSIAPNWNALGDVLSDPVGARPHSDLTLYSPVLETGYVAVHSATPAAGRDRALKAAAAKLKVGKADAESPLTNVVVIAENRDSALELKQEVERAGLKHIVYADDDHFWDPFPDGNWA